MKSYLKTFATETEATGWMRIRNQACRLAGNTKEKYAVCEGSDGGFAVVDIVTAINMGNGYTIEF